MSEPTNDGGPAFPGFSFTEGMSLRDYFAAKSMAAMCGFRDRAQIQQRHPDATPEEIEATIAQAAYIMADAMLEEREVKQS